MFHGGGVPALREARKLLERAEMAVGVRSRVGPPIGGGAGVAELLSLLPAGLAGAVVSVRGARSLTHTLAAQAMGDSGWAAFVGVLDAGWLAAHEAGVDLSRTIAVPAPGAAVVDVVAACVDGCDVVVLGREIDVGAGARRSLMGRIRARGTAVITGGLWPGATLLQAEVCGGVGAGGGAGSLHSWTLLVRRDGRGGVALEMGERPLRARRHLRAVS